MPVASHTVMQLITSEETITKKLQASGEVSVGFWGAEVKASASYVLDMSSKANQVSAVRVATFEEQVRVSLPTEWPKLHSVPAALLSSGPTGVQTFHQQFGHYFLYGFRRGGMVVASYSLTANELTSKEELAGDLSASWQASGGLASLKGAANNLKSNKSVHAVARIFSNFALATPCEVADAPDKADSCFSQYAAQGPTVDDHVPIEW